jgi:hypothetical protein
MEVDSRKESMKCFSLGGGRHWTRFHTYLDSGVLEPILESWWQRFSGPFLYYSGRRHLPAPLRAFVDFIEG